jgi:hypothetical protein
MKRKTVWFPVFRNVVPADFESWMEKLALKGWNVEKIGQWSSIKMNFIKTEPKKYRYIFDIKIMPDKDYKNIYEQFGWEYVGKMSSCIVWRKEYTDDRPESFSDKESIEKRNKNVMCAVMVSFIIFLIYFLVLTTLFPILYSKLSIDDILQFVIGIIISLTFTSYLGWVMHKIYKNKDR